MARINVNVFFRPGDEITAIPRPKGNEFAPAPYAEITIADTTFYFGPEDRQLLKDLAVAVAKVRQMFDATTTLVVGVPGSGENG